MVGFIIISWLLVGLMAWQITCTITERRHQQVLRRIPVMARPPRRMMDE